MKKTRLSLQCLPFVISVLLFWFVLCCRSEDAEQCENNNKITMSSSSGNAVVFLQDQGIPRGEVESKLGDNGFKVFWQAVESDSELSQTDASEVSVLVTVNKAVDGGVLAKYPNAKVLAVAFTGYGVHDLEACSAAGVVVCNVPDYSSDSVAELAIGLTLAVYREIPAGNSLVRDGKWVLSPGGMELRGKTVGIAGTGTIGTRVAQLFKAFGCKVVGWSRSQNPKFLELGGSYVSREELFSTSDVVSLHIPNNAQTRKMIGRADLERLRPSSVLINTARGQVVDEEALVDLLSQGKFRAGLDVFHAESAPAWASKVGQSTVLMPHVAYKTKEALVRRLDITVDNIRAALGGSPVNHVNK
jgi:lactate dehydrogenase-like 2-hydroxyacid dehydrogenase